MKMLAAVQLDDQPAFQAGEVHNVRSDRHLTAKARALVFFGFQPPPQGTLGFGRGTTKVARKGSS